jgi:hypothetical protein
MHIASARFRSLRSLVQNPLRGAERGQSRRRNLDFVPWSDLVPSLTIAVNNNAGEIMELLRLQPPDYGVHSTGIYIIGDDGREICAGPFDSETAAIKWIDQRQEISAHRSQSEAARH